MATFNITALFGGIGGMELGFHRRGHRTTLFCENDPEATAVLSKHFPEIPINFDVRETEKLASDVNPRSNLLTAGFPCTDLSQVGRTLGFDGAQSGLVRKVFDLLDQRPFPNILIENVPNWRVLHRGQYLTEVLEALEGRGYRWAYRTIDARAFGLPQRRLRLFVFASLEMDPRRALFSGDVIPSEQTYSLDEAAHGFYWTEGNRGLGWGEDCIPTLKGGSAVGVPAPPAIVLPGGTIITPHLRDGERLQGFAGDWTNLNVVPSRFGSREFNQRKRWMLIGNAVNVEVSSWIAENLTRTPRSFDLDGDLMETGQRWPSAAWFDGSVRRSVQRGSWPVRKASVPLASFLADGGRLLSLRACQGFCKRLIKSPLRVAPEFKTALAAHLVRMSRRERDMRERITLIAAE